MKIYTKTGDKGQTSLFDGKRVNKDHPRVETYGQIDELNSHIGLACALLQNLSDSEQTPELSRLYEYLLQVQDELFCLGSRLACENDKIVDKKININENAIEALEKTMDEWTQTLPPLKNFILPGGSTLASQLHICRTVCRRVERACIHLEGQTALNPIYIRYLNRLSDFFFLAARCANQWLHHKEIVWRS